MGEDALRRLKRALSEAQKFVNHQEALHKSNDNAD
jgi:ribosomal protein S21